LTRPARRKRRSEVFQSRRPLFRPLQDHIWCDRCMADLLVVLGIVGFTVAMLALVWALDRV
jgi:hypothetical protein